MKSSALELVCAALIALASSAAVAAAAPDCTTDREACIRLAAAETAAFIDECGKTYPESKADFDAALARWSLRKLQIPGVEDALKPGSADRVALRKKAATYMKSVGDYEREIECSSRMATLKSREPKLRADSVRLPKDPLEPYIK